MLRAKVLAGEMAEAEAAKMLNGKSPMAAQGKIPAMWPTPSAGDDRDRGNLSTPAIKRRAEKGKQMNLSMVVSEESGALNPVWVEVLMGFPPGYTDLT
jgi:hypothetical protein